MRLTISLVRQHVNFFLGKLSSYPLYMIFRMNTVACSVCKEAGHHTSRCPELSAPLKPGFFAPSGGGGGHSHDDDESLKVEPLFQHYKRQWHILATLSQSPEPLLSNHSS